MCWVAMDRAARLAAIRGNPELEAKWGGTAAEIHADILGHGLTKDGVLRQHYDTYHHMESTHNPLVREEWVDRFAIVGAPNQVRDKIKEIVDAGVDELTIIPCGPSKQNVLAAFARNVMAKL